MLIPGDINQMRETMDLVLNPHARISYSQFGEDCLIETYFHWKTTPGFYVDVGAHHPQRISNTHLLYKRGWRGINIEGDKELLDAFRLDRPFDTNIHALVSDKAEARLFRRFNEGAVNTLSDSKVVDYSQTWHVVEEIEVTTRTLADILDSALPAQTEIDLLSVDVEGFDLQALRGNDWNRYRPRLVVVEVDGLDLARSSEHDVVSFLSAQGYRLSGLIHVSAFFLRLD